MGKFSPVARAPKYMETFQCIGTACEETCCQGWHVQIDKRTMKMYQALPETPLKQRLKTIMIKAENPAGPHAHGHIQFDDKGMCPMLDEAKLCEVHRTLGPAYLTDTCDTYPRRYLRKDGELRLYADVSCPEAARKVLLAPDAMDAGRVTLPYANESMLPDHTVVNTGDPRSGLLLELFDLIADTALHIMRTPDANSWEALIILSLMVRRVAPHLDGEGPEAHAAIAQALLPFFEPDFLAEGRALARMMAPNRDLHNNISRPSFRAMHADAMRGIGFDLADPAGSLARYEEAERRWFTPFDDAHPYMLKNMLLNHMGKHLFPHGKARGLEKEFVDQALRYSLVKMHLIGLAGLKQEAFGGDDYVRVVFMFARNIEHHFKFLHQIHDLLEENGLNNTAAAALLVR
jgi:lysine-N-methylase